MGLIKVDNEFIKEHISFITIGDKKMDLTNKTISEIASIIHKDWGEKVYFGARPYLEAMEEVNDVNDRYMFEDGKTQVLYFEYLARRSCARSQSRAKEKD